ncbi:ATP-binding protein [Candidatus Pacearchaeota archaeon]|nr:ATP-binding protein [Candidatus Pacearchaeota archaeon]
MARLGRKLDTKVFAVETNARQTLEYLLNQFEEPEMCYRELVQNSLDAESPRIDINFEFTPHETEEKDGDPFGYYKKGKLVIKFEDYGTGMTIAEQEEYLTKLFASSKEGDTSKIGRFGIGFVSIFKLNPDEVIVESSKQDDNWKLVIDKNFSSKRFENEPRKGTKVRAIFNDLTGAEVLKMKDKAQKIVKQQCRFVKAPLFFEGQQINEPFDIKNAYARVHFKDFLSGIEGVIGLTKNNWYALLNNRLVIKERDNEIPPGLHEEGISVLVSSKELAYNLSRNDIIEDEKYKEVVASIQNNKKMLLDAVYDELSKRTLESAEKEKKPKVILNYTGKPTSSEDYDEVDRTLWQYAIKHTIERFKELKKLKTGKIKKALGNKANLPLFPTFNGTILTISDILDSPEKELYYSTYRDGLVEILLRQGKTVLISDSCRRDFFDDILKEYGKKIPQNVRETFYAPKIIFEDQLTENEKEFVGLISSAIGKTDLRKRYGRVLFGTTDWDSTVAFVNSDSLDSLGYKEEKQGSGIFTGRRNVLLNKNSDTITKLVRISKVRPELSQYLTLQIINTSDYESREYTKQLFDVFEDARYANLEKIAGASEEEK